MLPERGEAEPPFENFAHVPLRQGEPMLFELAGPTYAGLGHAHTIMDLLAQHDKDKLQRP